MVYFAPVVRFTPPSLFRNEMWHATVQCSTEMEKIKINGCCNNNITRLGRHLFVIGAVLNIHPPTHLPNYRVQAVGLFGEVDEPGNLSHFWGTPQKDVTYYLIRLLAQSDQWYIESLFSLFWLYGQSSRPGLTGQDGSSVERSKEIRECAGSFRYAVKVRHPKMCVVSVWCTVSPGSLVVLRQNGVVISW